MGAAENQNVSIYAGDKVSLRFPVSNGAGSPAILSAPTGVWSVAQGIKSEVEAAPVLTKTVRFVIETISAVAWKVAYVDLLEADTLNIPGTYQHQLRISDNATPIVAASGKFTVKRLID
jgi:hypothetical protein